MIRIYDTQRDEVIKALYMVGITNYDFALKTILPLISKLEIQRKLQSNKFYRRLENDIIKGCIMPPITIAFITRENIAEQSDIVAQEYILKNINDAFVLDGIQRLNTLKRASESDNFDVNRPIYINIILCKSMDNLLYRMITLNNGQKPMSIRHQIEILADNMYDFDNLNIKIKAEKENKKGLTYAFKKDDIIKAYTAFLGSTINFDNQKIIEDKLNEILAENIIDSNVTSKSFDFKDLIEFIKTESESSRNALEWFRISNNLIGFSAGVSAAGELPSNAEEFDKFLERFEEAFKTGLDVSKIKLGQTRRKLAFEIFKNYDYYKGMEVNSLIGEFADIA